MKIECARAIMIFEKLKKGEIHGWKFLKFTQRYFSFKYLTIIIIFEILLV